MHLLIVYHKHMLCWDLNLKNGFIDQLLSTRNKFRFIYIVLLYIKYIRMESYR